MSVQALGLSAAAPTPYPSLRRRMAAFVYEGILLFGVLMLAGWLYAALTGQHRTQADRLGLQVFLFAALCTYFVWFWTRSGQTLAMKTWQLRLVDAHGAAVTRPRAIARFLLSWLWFVPALIVVRILGLHDLKTVSAVVVAGVGIYALLALVHPRKQFLHDAVCGTQLIHAKATPPPLS